MKNQTHNSIKPDDTGLAKGVKRGLITVAALALITAVYAGYWNYLAGQIRTGIEQWAADRRAEGLGAEYAAVAVGGFPFRLVAEISAPALVLAGAVPGPARPWSWRGPSLIIEARPWALAKVRVKAPGRHRVIAMADGKRRQYDIEAGALAATLDFTPGPVALTIALDASDIVYPREHAELFQQSQQHGAVASEYPLGVRPDPRWFPRRNRLISGMSLGTLVVEAGEGSGARWTVHHALEQDREVFCVPGSIFSPVSRFTNRMIQEGAKLVSSYTDVLEELNLTAISSQLPLPLVEESGDEDESALLGHLSDEPVHIDDIRRSASLPIASVIGLLTMLELKGRVKQVGCMHYVRVREATPVYGS